MFQCIENQNHQRLESLWKGRKSLNWILEKRWDLDEEKRAGESLGR